MSNPRQYARELTKKIKNLSPKDKKRLRSGIVFCVVAVIGVIATTQIFATTGLNGKVGIGNFVWLDSNANGIVDGNEANQGINGVTVNLYNNNADTNSDGELSASELAAAVAVGTKTTANDPRAGATNGKPGYYQFNDLEQGNYFVGIAASNFGAGQPLEALMNVPVPNGVGDTQDDKSNHGKVPAGGTLAANGVISTRIKLQADTEPTIYSGKKDDDDNHDTDTTIDFGFWRSYSLGNRVWIDEDNSATINGADGSAPGVGGVTVRLLDSTGNTQLATTTTDSNGYYLFTSLNAGDYIVEVAASNFAQGGPLKNYAISSVGPAEEADPNSNGDSNDNGINPATAGQAVRSGTITLGPGASEPTNEADLGSNGQGGEDNYANTTVDFGFVGTASWGDTVFHDFDADGTQDVGDPGIANVTITLVCAGPDGDLTTVNDNTTQTQQTDADGHYLFVNLLPKTCKATVTTGDVPGATLTTPGTFTHTLVNQTSFLDADFGFVGNGVVGNQVFIDHNTNGRFDTGDVGVEGVTLDLYYDANSNGTIDTGEPVIKTTATAANGQYSFTQLPVGNATGMAYIVVVTDTANKLAGLAHVLGNGTADNESKNPAGFGVTLTPANPQRLEADFGYKIIPGGFTPPKLWKQQAVEGTSLRYTLTWINLSAINGISTSLNDTIPAGTSYVADSLNCEARGTSQTTSCVYNAQQNRIEWQGTFDADANHFTPDAAVNPIVVTYKVQLAEDTLLVKNQGYGSYAPISDTPVPSDWVDTPEPNDPTIYTRTKTNATIQNFSGGRLADTGQLAIVSLAVASTIIALGFGIVIWARHRQTQV